MSWSGREGRGRERGHCWYSYTPPAVHVQAPAAEGGASAATGPADAAALPVSSSPYEPDCMLLNGAALENLEVLENAEGVRAWCERGAGWLPRRRGDVRGGTDASGSGKPPPSCSPLPSPPH